MMKVTALGLTLVGLFTVGCGDIRIGKTSSSLDDKVTICHYTHSLKNPVVRITVAPEALPAHFANHGDKYYDSATGQCAACVSGGGQCDADDACCSGMCQANGTCAAEQQCSGNIGDRCDFTQTCCTGT